MGRPKKIVVQKLFTDAEIKLREGTWIEESDIKHPIVETNTDVYWRDSEGQEHLLLKFRKNKIKDNLLKLGWDSYKDLAKASRGRGASAGPVNAESDYWKKRNLVKTNKWSTGYLNPKGNELKELYDPMDLLEIRSKCQELEVAFVKEDDKIP